MRFGRAIAILLASRLHSSVSGVLVPTWPSPSDELEDIMFLNTGYRARGFAVAVTPCSFSAQGNGRIAAAEWIRTAFHDMATGNVETGVGGLDASLVYELGGDNIGPAFQTTFETFAPFLSTRSSMADIVALRRVHRSPLLPRPHHPHQNWEKRRSRGRTFWCSVAAELVIDTGAAVSQNRLQHQ